MYPNPSSEKIYGIEYGTTDIRLNPTRFYPYVGYLCPSSIQTSTLG